MATEAAAAAKRLEDEKNKDKVVQKVKLGDSADLHDQQDWAWDESDEDWTNTIDRKEKNYGKKRIAKKNKMEIEARVVKKARCIIGVGPVYTQSINHFYNIVGDYDDAKRMAAQEYLRIQLRFDEKEIEEMEISDTQISAKGANIIYIAMCNEMHIKDIRAKMAQVQDSELQMQDFIPPQIFKRYTALSKFAHALRTNDNTIKTQVRYGDRDVELWTKKRGLNERYTQMDMKMIQQDEQLPRFDHSIKWTRNTEIPPRREVSPTRHRAEIPSLGKTLSSHKLEAESNNKKPRRSISDTEMNTNDEENESEDL